MYRSASGRWRMRGNRDDVVELGRLGRRRKGRTWVVRHPGFMIYSILKNTYYIYICIYTLPETNIAPENSPSQKEISIPTIHVRVLC